MANKKMSKKDLKDITFVKVPIFGGWVVLTLDEDQHDRVMDWHGVVKSDRPPADEYFTPGVFGFCHDLVSTVTGEHLVIVHIANWELDTLVHELAHAVFRICDRKGIETHQGNRETFCYLQDFLFGQFYGPTTKRWQLEEDKLEAEEKKNADSR